MDTLIQDIRYALRGYRRAPVFAATVVVTVALGLGATSTLFSAINGLLLRPLPVPAADGLVTIQEDRTGLISSGQEGVRVPWLRYRAYAEATGQIFTELAAYRRAQFGVRIEDIAVPRSGQLVSGNYFATLGVAPAIGRFFEADNEPSVVLEHGTWQLTFGGDPNVLGRTIHVDGRPMTVVGVAPEGFRGTLAVERAEMWVPYEAATGLDASATAEPWVGVFGRLRPGVTRPAAGALVAAVGQNLPPETPQVVVRGARLEPMTGLSEENRRTLVWFLGPLLGAAGLVLLIGVLNVTGILLARSTVRRREIAVRLAVGASTARVARQLLTENLILFLMGGAAGLLIARGATDLLARAPLPADGPTVLEIAPDVRVLIFGFGLAMSTGLLAGLMPALQSARAEISGGLRDGGWGATAGGGRRLAFVAIQLSFAVLLLVCCALLARTSFAALATDPGFTHREVLVATIDLRPHSAYDEELGRAYFDALVERVAALPEVESAARAQIPLVTGDALGALVREREDGTAVEARFNVVDHGYLETMRFELAAGRGIIDTDRLGAAPVAVVNETLARRLWPGQNPIGEQVIGQSGSYEVVGVIRDGKYTSLWEDPRPFVFLSAGQHHAPEQVLHVRVGGPTGPAIEAIRREAAALDPDIPLQRVELLSALVATTLFPQRAAAILVGVFALLGLVLSSVGLYGVLAHEVGQRTRELAIRSALGASRRDVVRMVLGRAARISVAGVAFGLVLAVGASHLLRTFIFGIHPLDPFTFVGVPLVLGCTTLIASWLPARAATRVEAAGALRRD
jgi:predicted permease